MGGHGVARASLTDTGWQARHPAYQLASKRHDTSWLASMGWHSGPLGSGVPARLRLSASSRRNASNILNFRHYENRLDIAVIWQLLDR